MILTQKIIDENHLKQHPKIYSKNGIYYGETIYGSFVNLAEYGMAQQKNAMSEKELIKFNYKLIK